MKLRTAVLGAGLTGAVIAALVTGTALWTGNSLVGAATVPGCGASYPHLTVDGSGIATGTPDLLTLTATVSVAGSSAQAALSDDNTQTASVVTALTAGGVTSKDIQTTGLSVQPAYTSRGGTTVLTGYSVDNNVIAKIRNFATAGGVIDAVTTAAGNDVQINSLTFSIADPRALQDKARKDAVGQAVSHAATMAAAASERLGRVCSITDQSSTSASPQPFSPEAASGSSASPAAVPLEAGTQEADAQVTIVYSIEPAQAKH